MTEVWFPAQIAPYFSLLSLVALISCLEAFAQRGEHRAVVTLAYRAAAAFGFVLLLAGIWAFVIHQPWHVWFTLGFSGGVIFPICIWALARIGKLYQGAELRRSIADDL
jgi:hypothetical protein